MEQQESKLDIACREFDEGKLAFGHAARLADLSEMGV